MRSVSINTRIAIVCIFASAIGSPALAESFSFDDIEFWVGSGANRAALVIDWQEDSTQPPALVWGYRWDDTVTGSDMLAAIVSADPRLYAKFDGTTDRPVRTYGLGYDANDDSSFGTDDNALFDEQGIAITGAADGALGTDPADYYAEGWFTAFWHYGNAEGNPFDQSEWTSSPVGGTVRMLVDGAWDSWTFSPTFSFEAFAENPQAAASPYPPGDYDRNGEVEEADYQFWKDNFGSTTTPEADGNRDGIVNAADYTVWRDHLGATTSSAASISATVPEPSTLWLTLLASLFCSFRIRKENVS